MDPLNRRIVSCQKCPRLRSWCLEVAASKRKSFAEDVYWGLPVPNFGDPDARGLIIGLAPAAHGANRTGRMFTGDRSGEWLYRALHKAGLANQPVSDGTKDGLRLKNVLITAVAHCAPPDNKPTRQEVENCRPFLSEVIGSKNWATTLCLGALAWTEAHRLLNCSPPKFAHGAMSYISGRTIIASYHPSQQNTFTGRLTEEMFDDVISRFARSLD